MYGDDHADRVYAYRKDLMPGYRSPHEARQERLLALQPLVADGRYEGPV
jgi:hypothetical protein